MKRPTAITVIGWIWIAVGVYLLSTLPEAVFNSAVFYSEGGVWNPRDYFGVTMMCLAGAGTIFTIVAAVGFLKCRRWAWISLRVLSWIGLAWAVVYVPARVRILVLSALRATWGPFPYQTAWDISRAVPHVPLGIMFVAGLISMIKFLRSKSMREVFGRQSTPDDNVPHG